MAKPRKQELRVIFDTNVLYTQTFGELLKPEIGEFITANCAHPDLTVVWYLPDVVRHEREYQMRREAVDLLPAIGKIEKLLTHRLNITAENVAESVSRAVDRAITANKLQLLPTDPSKVDWPQIILNSVYRYPPFEPGKTEKGFRDAMIAEAFMQLANDSPRTAAVCRVTLVTGDGGLRDAVIDRTRDFNNVRVVSSIEELGGLINTIVSTVSEELVAQIREKAQVFFFLPEDKDTYYYKEEMGVKVKKQFAEEFVRKPEGVDEVTHKRWTISIPEFQKKHQQRYHWITRLTAHMEAYRQQSTPPSPPNYLALLAEGATTPPSTGLLEPFIRADTSKIKVMEGRLTFTIGWSVRVNATKKLSAPQTDGFKYEGAVWKPLP